MTIRDTLRSLIVTLRTPAQYFHAADELEQLAADLRARGEALARDQTRPPALRVKPRACGAGPGRAPGDFLRIERVQRRTPHGNSADRDVERSSLRRGLAHIPRVRLMIGRALYYDKTFGAPPYIGLDLRDDGLVILPFREAAPGRYRVVLGSGMPRAWCDGSRGLLKAYADGRYAGIVHPGALHVGAALDLRPAAPAIQGELSEAEIEARAVAEHMDLRRRANR